MKKSEKKLKIFPSIRSKAQVKLSFGMIFSIILMIVFIAFAFFAIQKFLGLKDTISVGKFVDDFQSDVNKLWKSSQGSQELEYSLPKKIEYVCFANLLKPEQGAYEDEDFYEEFRKYFTDENLFFYPVDSTELNGLEIKHIDIEKITENENPFCIENIKGKIKIVLKKDFGDALVSVTSLLQDD